MAELSAKEAEIYDRQIRLWGVEAQQRLRGARVFVCGLTGLGGEVCKNLVLAGISVTLLDDATVTPEQLGAANFLLDADSLGKNVRQRARARAQRCPLPPTPRANCLAPAPSHTRPFTLSLARCSARWPARPRRRSSTS
jgi:ubiquitin-like 1-activating enzyme E1 A